MTEPWNATSTPASGDARRQINDTAGEAKQQAGQVAGTARQQAADVKDTTLTHAGEVKDHAVDQAQNVKDAAVDATQQVADTAKVEAGQVVQEARTQIQSLVDTTRDEVRSRAQDGHTALATTLGGLTDELGSISRGQTTTGPVNQLIGELATRGESLSGWLQTHDPDDVVHEVRRFAARRPMAFLAIAAGAGMLAGRLARGTREVAKDEQDRAQLRGGTTRSPQRPVAQPSGYQASNYPQSSYPTNTAGEELYSSTPRFQNVGNQGDFPTGGLQEQVDREDGFQPRVTEGYVHTTVDPEVPGTQGGLR